MNVTEGRATALRTLWCTSLLEQLRREGFDIGLRQHLQVESLLDTVVDSDVSVESLKSILCPVVARSAEEQQRFSELFDVYVSSLAGEEPYQPAPVREHQAQTLVIEPVTVPWIDRVSVRRSLFALGAVAAIAISFAVAKILPDCLGPSCTFVAPDSTIVPPPPVNTVAGALQYIVPQQVQFASTTPETVATTIAPNVWLARAAAFVLPFVCFAVFAWWRRRRQVATVEKQSNTQATLVWPIDIPPAGRSLYPVAELAATARALRRRQAGSEVRLAIEPSVRATIRARGFASFAFVPVTRPSEYLVLIERSSARDNQARYFDSLVKRLQEEGAFITTLFFDRDPRVCYRESDGRSFKLTDLARLHDTDRLLIFSDGLPFLHPVRGTPFGWIEVFDAWKDRAILTPLAPRHWNTRHRTLSRSFLVLPSTLEGIRAAADHFDANTRSEIARWKERDRTDRSLLIASGLDAAELRDALGDDVFRWCAACAFYPELYWDLTARLGEIPAISFAFSERNALQLVQLPWFRDGIMPEELQRDLQQSLRTIDPLTTSDVHANLYELLDRQKVSLETVGGQLQRKQLLAQRLYVFREDKTVADAARRELAETFPPEELVRDVTVARLLDETSSPLALKLPRAVRDRLWRGGHPAFGVRTMTMAIVPAVAGAVMVSQIDAPTPSSPPPVASRVASVVPDYRSIALPPARSLVLGAAVIDSLGATLADEYVEWKSADSAVATITEGVNGVTTLRSTRRIGSTALQAARDSSGTNVNVTVQSAQLSTLVWTSAGIRISESAQLGAANRRAGWLSCNPSVVAIDPANATVTAVSVGSAIVIRKLVAADVRVAQVSGATPFLYASAEVQKPSLGEEVQIIHVLGAVAGGDSSQVSVANPARGIDTPISPYPRERSNAFDTVFTRHLEQFKALHQRDSLQRLTILLTSVGDSGTTSHALYHSTLNAQVARLGLTGLVTVAQRHRTDNCDAAALTRASRIADLDRVDFLLARVLYAGAPAVNTNTNAVRPASGTGAGANRIPDKRPSAIRPPRATPPPDTQVQQSPVQTASPYGNTLPTSDGDSQFVSRVLRYTRPNSPTVGLQSGVRSLQGGTSRASYLVNAIDEKALMSVPKTQLVRDLVQLTLCRAPEAGEIDAFAAELDKVGPRQFAQLRLASSEGQRALTNCVSRGPTAR